MSLSPHISCLQAQQAFKNSQPTTQPKTRLSVTLAPLLPALEVLVVDVGCSQAILDLVVSFVYSKGMKVSAENAAELLAVGDFLQVPPLPFTHPGLCIVFLLMVGWTNPQICPGLRELSIVPESQKYESKKALDEYASYSN